MNDHPLLADTDMQGLTIEDNLSTHLTEATLNYWANELTNFLPPKMLPANMTDIIQVIDRHIGIRYKRAVYLAMRKEMMRRLAEAREAAGGTEFQCACQ